MFMINILLKELLLTFSIKRQSLTLINFCFLFLLQARNSYSNEVVAIKKMSYNGKQTTEVRENHTQAQTQRHLQHVNASVRFSYSVSPTVSPKKKKKLNLKWAFGKAAVR